MRIPIIICVLTAASLSSLAHAQSSTARGPGWEAGVDVIYQDSLDLSFEGGTRASLDASWGLSLNATYRFNDRFEMGLGLDWLKIDYDATLQSGLFSDVSADVSGDMETFTPRVWGNFNFMEGPITPFLTAGVGWGFVDTNIPNSRVQVGCWWDPWWGYICTPYQSTKSVDDLVYDVGLGVRWDVAPGYTLRLAYEKHWFDYDKATSRPDFDQIKLGVAFRF